MDFILLGSNCVKHIQSQQYDPLIIKRTISSVLGPSTDLYIHFLKARTLTNKAVGTYRPCPNLRGDVTLILVSSNCCPRLLSHCTWARIQIDRSQPTLVDIFIYSFKTWDCVCSRFLRPLRLGWLLVSGIYKEASLQCSKCVSFLFHIREWEGLAHKLVNYSSWVTVCTPIDRPK